MIEEILNEIKTEDAYQEFRKNWNIDKLIQRDNTAEASLSAKQGGGWLSIGILSVDTDENEPDAEIRQEMIDFQLEQDEKRLQLVHLVQTHMNSQWILPSESAVHVRYAEDGTETYYFTTVYSHKSGCRLEPLGLSDSTVQLQQLAADLCHALIEIHDTDQVHQYVHPDNIFYADGRYCLGRAGLRQDVEWLRKSGYITRETCDAQTDIYMLGQTLQRLMPVPTEESGKMDKSLARLSEVIKKACEPDKVLRYQSAEEMLADLEKTTSGNYLWLFTGAVLIFTAVILCIAFWPDSSTETPEEAPAVEMTAEPTKETMSADATIGDPNGDHVVDALDAAAVLEKSASAAFVQISEEELVVYDVNADGEVNAMDSYEILSYSAHTASGNAISFEEYLAQGKED